MDDAGFRREHRKALIDDRVSGASQLARQALDSLAEFAGTCQGNNIPSVREQLLAFGEELQFARPGMAPVYNLVQYWVDQVERLEANDLATFRRRSAELAQEYSDLSLSALERAASRAAELIADNTVVITHSFSSTVRQAFHRARQRNVQVIVSESRPGMEGRDQARYLAAMNIQVTYVTDAELGLFTRRATMALVGADTVLADGSVVNKAGTYLLALAARDQEIPLYICCESFKHAPFHPSGFELEELPTAELEPPRHKCITPRNVLFDITPARLVGAWITEKGVKHNRHRG